MKKLSCTFWLKATFSHPGFPYSDHTVSKPRENAGSQGVVQETQEVQNYQEYVFIDFKGLNDPYNIVLIHKYINKMYVWINDTDRTMSGCCHVSKLLSLRFFKGHTQCKNICNWLLTWKEAKGDNRHYLAYFHDSYTIIYNTKMLS